MYDPQIGRWHVPDPLAEYHFEQTLYTYVYNNPINLIDPFGLDTVVSTTEPDPNNMNGTGAYDMPEPVEEVVVTADKPIDLEKHTEENKKTLKQRKPSKMEKWAKSEKFIPKLSYEILNDAFQVVQIFDFDLLARNEWKNPFTGGSYGNLDGTPNYNQTNGVVNTVAIATPITRGTASFMPKGLTFGIKKLNAAQFSKLFKGSFILQKRLGIRGISNRYLNKGINSFDKSLESGNKVLLIRRINQDE